MILKTELSHFLVIGQAIKVLNLVWRCGAGGWQGKGVGWISTNFWLNWFQFRHLNPPLIIRYVIFHRAASWQYECNNLISCCFLDTLELHLYQYYIKLWVQNFSTMRNRNSLSSYKGNMALKAVKHWWKTGIESIVSYWTASLFSFWSSAVTQCGLVFERWSRHGCIV
jgi:hypothetical protein